MTAQGIVIRQINPLQPYAPIWDAMRDLTQNRTPDTPDELWLLQHTPVFTLGQAGREEHILRVEKIPIIKVDRGGQVTYHGPGQLMAYTLIDLRRKQLSVHGLVHGLEKIIVELLKNYGIEAYAKCEAPGVYVNNAKICSVGLRIKRGCSFHGLAFNVAMDTTPFSYINPCGFKGLAITQLSDFIPHLSMEEVTQRFIHHFCHQLEYTPSLKILD